MKYRKKQNNYSDTDLQEAANTQLSTEAKSEIKKAVDSGATADAVNALVQQKAIEADPQKSRQFMKLKD